MKEIIEKLCNEEGIDQDIKDFMLADSKSIEHLSSTTLGDPIFYKNWQLIEQSPVFMLMWQELRDRKRPSIIVADRSGFSEEEARHLAKLSGHVVVMADDKEALKVLRK